MAATASDPGFGTRSPGLAFTLIELLVAISIIMILAMLLVSILPRIREQGRSVTCLSNLRQIGMATLGYTDDHHGILPLMASKWNPVTASVLTNTDFMWHQSLVPYILSQHEGRLDQDSSSARLSADLRFGVLTCPSWSFGFAERYGTDGRWHDGGVVWHKPGYGMNGGLHRAGESAYLRNWWNPQAGWYPQLFSNFHYDSISHPSQRILIGDSTDWHLVGARMRHDGAGPSPWWLRPDGRFHDPSRPADHFQSGHPNRHGSDRANYLMVDLSVQSLSMTDAALAIVHPGG
jgi:hypothetical protein